MPSPQRPRSPFRSPLRVEPLEGRDVPAFLTGADVVVGADAGSPPLVRVIDASTQTVQSQFLAFDGDFYGGVRVAVADVDGDGTPDLITAAGPSGTPSVDVYSGADGSVLASFLAFDEAFTGGVNIAAGDVDGDGKADVIAGAGAGGGPAVAVFDGGGNKITSFYAYAANFNGGVRVAAADPTGTGRADVVTVPGYGGGPDLRLYRISGGGSAQVGGFQAFDDARFTGGSYVAAGDLTGDGKDDIVVGAGPGGGPRVGVYTAGGGELASYYAYASDFLGGVRVGVANLEGGAVADVLTVAGPGGASQVNVFPGTSATPTVGLDGFPASQMTGAFVAGSGVVLNLPTTPADDVSASYAGLEAFQQNGQSIVPYPVYVPLGYGGYGGYYPYSPFGYGFGGLYGGGLLGSSYYDGSGLYSPLRNSYQSSFFGNGYFGSPTYVSAPSYYGSGGSPIAPGYFDPEGYPTNPGYLAPQATPSAPETLPAPTPLYGDSEAVASSGYGGYSDYYGGYGGGDYYGGYGGGDFGGFGDEFA